MAIPDNRPNGVINNLTIPDDFEIADLYLRIDNLPHIFPGDLTFGLRGPGGYGTDAITFLGGGVAAGGDGDKLLNTVIDDEGTGNLLLATNAQAPYTGSWKPIFDSPSWVPLSFPPLETVSQLSNFDGTSTLGTWKAIVSEQAVGNTGTRQSWSLIITPRNFVCIRPLPRRRLMSAFREPLPIRWVAPFHALSYL